MKTCVRKRLPLQRVIDDNYPKIPDRVWIFLEHMMGLEVTRFRIGHPKMNDRERLTYEAKDRLLNSQGFI